MNISENGIQFTAENEGYTPVPKLDIGGKLVWGHGHDQQPGEIPPKFISLPDSDALLRKDYAERYVPAANAEFERINWTPNQNQAEALYDFCYQYWSDDLRKLLSHGVENVPYNLYHVNPDGSQHGYIFADGEIMDGLVERRKKEISLFLS